MKHSNPHPSSPRVGIHYTDQVEKERAEQLAAKLSLPVVTDRTGYDFLLGYIKNRLTLSLPERFAKKGQAVSLCIDFIKGPAGYRRKHGGKEMLLRAIGFRREHPQTVLDATGGTGTDCFLMASYGCTVFVFEQNRIAAALLEDGLQRATLHPETGEIASRIHLQCTDSRKFLNKAAAVGESMPEVIYLDPMFPKRSKSALVKKEMLLLQKLVGRENDAEKLFAAALGAAVKRVVVKRPKSAPPLANSTPSHSLTGRTTRFDVYMI